MHRKLVSLTLLIALYATVPACVGAAPEGGVVSNAAIRWTADLPGTGYQTPRTLAVDAEGIVVAGQFTGTLSFLSGPETSASEDGFIAMFDPSGAPRWSAVLRGAGDESVNTVQLVGSMVLIGGTVEGPVTLGQASLPATDGAPRGFMAALSRDTGETLWLEDLSPSGATSVDAITSDGTDVFIAGTMSSSAEYWSLIARVQPSDGAVLWVQQIRAMGNDAALPDAEVVNLILDPAGALVIGGMFTGTALMPFGQWPSLDIQSAFAARLTRDGQPIELIANLFRKDHEQHSAHSHLGLIDRMTFLSARPGGKIIAGGSQFETLAHEGVPDRPSWASRAVLVDLSTRGASLLTEVQDETLLALAAEASPTQTQGRFATSTTGNPFGNPETQAQGRESVSVFDMSTDGQRRALAWIETPDLDVRAVATADTATGLIVLLSRRTVHDETASGTTALVELDL